MTVILVALWMMRPVTATASTNQASDDLDRSTPRSSVTAFLEACQSRDYPRASQYLDLRRIPASMRNARGPELAQGLEALLNADAQFNVLSLERHPEGDLTDDPDPNREHVATVTKDGRNLRLDLERVTPRPALPPVWLVSHDTVAAIPKLHPSSVSPRAARYLPGFLTSGQILETPIWKWVVLAVIATLMVTLSRLLDRGLAVGSNAVERLFQHRWHLPWLVVIIEPLRVVLWLALFRIAVEILNPSAIARLYIGRGCQVLLVWSIAWCLIRLVELSLSRVELSLDVRQQPASRAMLRLGSRAATVTIVILAALVLLQNWGYNTSALIAGLGVGGVAVALAAQQTISNVFGGVSLVGDHPVRIGDFGKFGDMVGSVEDIGMRSTRIRTLNRTIVSVPNASFASLNLENYSIRDKILFNPTFCIRRTTPPDKVRTLMDAIESMLAHRSDVESPPTPARLVGLASGAFSLELFCYIRTPDLNAFYRIQGDLLLHLNEIFEASDVDLA
jgi:MscS family membrane protein